MLGLALLVFSIGIADSLNPTTVGPALYLALGGHAFLDSRNPTAARLLRETGLAVHELDLDEFALADGGPTCLVNVLP